jgi:hypothetical protein
MKSSSSQGTLSRGQSAKLAMGKLAALFTGRPADKKRKDDDDDDLPRPNATVATSLFGFRLGSPMVGLAFG